MAAKKSSKKSKPKTSERRFQPIRWLKRWIFRGVLAVLLIATALIVLWANVNPPTTYYIVSERWRLGAIKRDWVAIEDVSPVMARSIVAAEDANFCLHWGFDVSAIRSAISQGGSRGASTLTQQVVKNVYLWHGRSWIRKAVEAALTPAVEAVWSKRRIIEVYMNIAEFDEGVFGVNAAAQHYFGVAPQDLTKLQAARLAAVLPAPKKRSASRPTPSLRKRTAAILDGAATIQNDGRATCFQD